MNRRKLVLAMEDILDTSIHEVQEVDMDEVQDLSDDIDDTSEDLTAVMEDMETLSNIRDVMEDSLESGKGLSPEAAEIATLAVESIYSRWGLSNNNSIPAIESFQNRNSKLVATRFAMEGIGDNLKAAGKWLLEQIKKLWNFLTDLFKKIVGSVEADKKENEELKKQVRSLEAPKKQTAEAETQTEEARTSFDNLKIATTFNIKSKESSFEDVLTAIECNLAAMSVIKFADWGLNNYVSKLGQMVKALVIDKSTTVNNEDISSARKKAEKQLMDGWFNTAIQNLKRFERAKKNYKIKTLLDNRTIEIFGLTNNQLLYGTADRTLMIGIMKGDDKYGYEGNTEVKILDASEKEKLLEECKKLIEAQESFLNIGKKSLDSILKDLTDLANTLNKSDSSFDDFLDENKEARVIYRELKAAVDEILTKLPKVATSLPILNVKAIRTAHSYARQSI